MPNLAPGVGQMTLLDAIQGTLFIFAFLASAFGAMWPLAKAINLWIDDKNKQAAKFATAGAITVAVFLTGAIYLAGQAKESEPQCPQVTQQR